MADEVDFPFSDSSKELPMTVAQLIEQQKHRAREMPDFPLTDKEFDIFTKKLKKKLGKKASLAALHAISDIIDEYDSAEIAIRISDNTISLDQHMMMYHQNFKQGIKIAQRIKEERKILENKQKILSKQKAEILEILGGTHPMFAEKGLFSNPEESLADYRKKALKTVLAEKKEQLKNADEEAALKQEIEQIKTALKLKEHKKQERKANKLKTASLESLENRLKSLHLESSRIDGKFDRLDLIPSDTSQEEGKLSTRMEQLELEIAEIEEEIKLIKKGKVPKNNNKNSAVEREKQRRQADDDKEIKR